MILSSFALDPVFLASARRVSTANVVCTCHLKVWQMKARLIKTARMQYDKECCGLCRSGSHKGQRLCVIPEVMPEEAGVGFKTQVVKGPGSTVSCGFEVTV